MAPIFSSLNKGRMSSKIKQSEQPQEVVTPNGRENCEDDRSSQSDASAEPTPSLTSSASEAEVQLEFMDKIATVQQDRKSSKEIANASSPEIDRLRNFLQFTLAVDYRCDLGTIFTSGDRAHFSTMKIFIDDLAATSETIKPTSEERAALAPFFWHGLHQPCIALGLPVELVLDCVMRFFRFQGSLANYKGCLEGIPLTEGTHRLAAKLVTDREILIPRVVTNPVVREKMFRSLQIVSGRYFERLPSVMGITHFDNTATSTDSFASAATSTSTSTSASTTGSKPSSAPTSTAGSSRRSSFQKDRLFWSVTQKISYKLNPRGQEYAQNKEASASSKEALRLPGFMSACAQKAKEGLGSMLGRSADVKAGRAPMELKRQKGAVLQRTYYLPDFFDSCNPFHRRSSVIG